MARIKILIVEDELIIAQDISFKLEDLGYQVIGMVTDQEEMQEVLNKNIPDLILFDVELNGEEDGIDLAAKLKGAIPFVYLTSHADLSTVSRAKATKPNGYLLKPIEKKELYASIEMALATIDASPKNLNDSSAQQLFVQDGEALVKVDQNEVLWLKAEGNYTSVHTQNRRYLVRGNIKETRTKLADYFFRIHKSYVVNLNKIEKITAMSVYINEEEIPIGKTFREDFLLNINRL